MEDNFDSKTSVKKMVMVRGRPVAASKENSQMMKCPAPPPSGRGPDGYLAAVTFTFVMTLAAIVVVLYAPLPRAQLVGPLVAGMLALLTAALGQSRRR